MQSVVFEAYLQNDLLLDAILDFLTLCETENECCICCLSICVHQVLTVK